MNTNTIILLTAFKGEYNSSYQLIKNIECDKLYLTNSFKGIEKDIQNFDFSKYSAVIMFGLDTRLKDRVRIDVKAQIEDVVIDSNINTTTIFAAFAEYGIPYYTCEKPTKYLCNYAYYLMLKKTKENALFIHIPSQKNMTNEIKQNIISAIEKLI